MFRVSHAMQAAVAGALVLPERWKRGVAYNPLSPRTVRDPYPVLAALRAQAPVHRSRFLNAWVFTRYADVRVILRDHRRFGNDPRKSNLSLLQRAILPPPHEYSMLLLDPPDHTRLRALVSGAFTPRAVDALEPRVRGILGTLLGDIRHSTAFDFMDAVAHPLPVMVIAGMLGLPPRDWRRFKVWSARRARLLEPRLGRGEGRAGKRVSSAFAAYVRPIIEERRARPREDIVTALVWARQDGAQLSGQETVNMLRLLLAAGSETTANLIGNGILALLRHPDQMERLREDPALIPSAVEELLRFDAPVQVDYRRVLADCEVNGFALRKRDNVVVLLGAANRDPAVFENPDRLDVGRDPRSHLSFGSGIHHCLGAPLARLQGRIALEMLLERFRSIRLTRDRPRYRPSIIMRGLESLPVRCLRA
ncbi:MAG: cytochrome P450 [Gammaproteobacteria bacterium]|nr:cytochrome P450 [Gammaproteobacteria bacterium]MYC51939.1 cytochrome P450 [Gammaproteobacteria bacterium]